MRSQSRCSAWALEGMSCLSLAAVSARLIGALTRRWSSSQTTSNTSTAPNFCRRPRGVDDAGGSSARRGVVKCRCIPRKPLGSDDDCRASTKSPDVSPEV